LILRIAKVWDGYQDDRYSGHKLPKKFQDDAGTEQEPERQSQTIVTPEQKPARQAKVRKLAGNSMALDDIAKELEIPLTTVYRDTGKGAWGKLG